MSDAPLTGPALLRAIHGASGLSLSTQEVADRLHVSRKSVNKWCGRGMFAGVTGGGQGVAWRIPHSALAGFTPPEGSLLTDRPGRADGTLGTSEVAARYGVATETVRHWCHAGLFDGATGGTPGVPWQIPAAALEDFVQPVPGRCSARANAPRCIACTIILDEEWCEWDADGVCDACQALLAVICRRTGAERGVALAQWMEREEVLV